MNGFKPSKTLPKQNHSFMSIVIRLIVLKRSLLKKMKFNLTNCHKSIKNSFKFSFNTRQKPKTCLTELINQ